MRRQNPELRLTAFHEAGHAVAELHLGHRSFRVTVAPDSRHNRVGTTQRRRLGQRGAERLAADLAEGRPRGIGRLINTGVGVLSGWIAEERAAGHPIALDAKTLARSDDYVIFQNVIFLATGSAEPTDDPECKALGDFLSCRAHKFVASHWREIKRVAAALLARGSLSRSEVERAARGHTPARKT